VKRLPSAFLAIATALSVVPLPAVAGILQTISTPFDQSTRPVEIQAAAISLYLFTVVFPIEVSYALYRAAYRPELPALIENYAQAILCFGVGWFIVSQQVFLTDQTFDLLARLSTQMTAAGGVPPLTPDGIAGLGYTLSIQLSEISTGNIFTDGFAGFVQQIAGVLLNIAFCIVAVEEAAIKIGTQFCVAVAGCCVGLMGSRWTRPYAAGFPRIVFATFILFVTVNAVAAVGIIVSNDFMQTLASLGAQPISGIVAGFEMIAGGAVVYMVIAVAVPGIAVFLGATTPLPGGAAAFAAIAAMRGGGGGSSGGSNSSSTQSNGTRPTAQLERASRTS
jgi:hypothetical protein